jgi:hypothetical protein
MRTALIAPALTLGLMALVAPTAANAAPPTTKELRCVASDPSDVTVDSDADSVTIKDDTSTAGNNFGCYTQIKASAGDTITFVFTGACGGGVPRLFVRFAGGAGENTFDTGTCVSDGSNGTVTYTLVNSGNIKSFALINDSGNGGTITYSKVVIAGETVNF